MAIKFSNNASTSIQSAIQGANNTSFTVASAANFPTLGAGDYAYVTLISNTAIEVVKVTAISGVTFTFERLPGATVINDFEVNDSCELRITTELLEDFGGRIDANEAKTANNTSPIQALGVGDSPTFVNPTVDTPTAVGHVANKAYVDAGALTITRDEDDLGGATSSDLHLATQQSIKAYVDTNVLEPTGSVQALGTGDSPSFAVVTAAYSLTTVYGVSWNETTDTYSRTGGLAGQPVSTSLADAFLPIQALMRRCLLANDGTVNYYLDANNSIYREDGTTPSDLEGGDGQVMLEIPKFWYKYSYAKTTHTWEISLTAQVGFAVHPAFNKNGAVVENRYIGAYEGIKYDAGTSLYVDGISHGIDTTNDILSSVSGSAPWTDDTRAEVRAVAANRGVGWRQQDYDLTSAIQLLYIVEYADWNSQLMIGPGRTELTAGGAGATGWVKDGYIGITGKSNSDGNITNSVGGDTNNAYMTYRGIENFYGNVYKWVDGISINSNVPWVHNTDTEFVDDAASTTNYTDLGVTLAAAHGWQKTLAQQYRGFLPATVVGSSTTYITDYYYQAAGWRVVLFGGYASSGADAGVAYWIVSVDSAAADVYFGGRLAY